MDNETYYAVDGGWKSFLNGHTVSTSQTSVAKTMFGAATNAYPGTGFTWAQAITAHEDDCGPMGVLRSYGGTTYGTAWNSGLSDYTNPTNAPNWQNRPSWHSINPNLVQMASGSLDAWLDTYLDSIPVTGKTRMLTIWHEPDVKQLNATDFVNATVHFINRIHAHGHPDVVAGPILGGSFYLGTPRPTYKLEDYLAPAVGAVADFIGFDPYNEGSKQQQWNTARQDPSYYFQALEAYTATVSDAPFAVGETGYVTNPADLTMKPTWIQAVVDRAVANHWYACCYFDTSLSNPWWLRMQGTNPGNNPGPRDDESIAVWAAAYAR